MNIKLVTTRYVTRMLFCLALAGTLALGQNKDTADVVLQRAIQKEMVDGDLKAAIELYKKVLSTKGVPSSTAAQALLRMGISYEKLDDADARKAYQKVVTEYSNERTPAAEAQRRLAMTSASTSTSSPNLAMRQICNRCADDDGSITADGRYLLMTDPDTGDIAIRDLSTGESKKLMAKTGGTVREYAIYPVMSPDQKLVTYTWFMGDYKSQLMLMGRAPGSRPTVLLDRPEYSSYRPEAWSRDGKAILVTTTRTDQTRELAWVSVPGGTVKVVKPLQRRLVMGRPRLSPDGRYIVYSAVNPSNVPPADRLAVPDQDIYIIPADGSGSEVALVKGPNRNEFPVWSPDGAHILFLRDRLRLSEGWGLYSVGVQNGQVSGFPRLERETGRIRPIGVSDAGSLYFVESTPRSDQIFIGAIRRNASGAAPVASGDITIGGQSPGWSPDGKYLAFARERVPSRVFDAVVRNVQTGEERTYSRQGFAAGYTMLWFSDSSSFLAWGSEPSTLATQRVIYRVNVATKQWEPLSTLNISVLAPATGISGDGQTIFKGARDPRNAQNTPNRPFDRILAVDVKTGQEKQVLMLPEAAYTFRLSPDGQTFVLHLQPDSMKEEFYLARMSIDGSNYRRLAGPFTGVTFSWTGNSRSLIVGVREISKPAPALQTYRIMELPVDGGTLTSTGLTVSGLGSLAVNQDGSQIAYSATNDERQEVWALDNVSSLFNNVR